MRPELVALAHEAQRLTTAGETMRAREKWEEFLNGLLNREPTIGRFRASVLPGSVIGVRPRSEILVMTVGDRRSIYVPEEMLRTNILPLHHDRFETVRRVFMTRPVLALPAGEAIWDLGDAAFSGQHPRVAFCSNLSNTHLVADSYFLAVSNAGLRAKFQAHWSPWEERKTTVFWRGSTSGQWRYLPERGKPVKDWRWLQRLHLCDVAAKSRFAEQLDVGVIAVNGGDFAQIDDEFLANAIRAAGFQKQHCPKLEYLNYRYIIDIDGNGNAWNGLFTAMLTGATIFKVASPFGFRQWYYDKLVPWENYIPVREDLSDFDERVDWAFSHPAECAIMGRSIKALADAMTYESELQVSGEVFRQALAQGPTIGQPARSPAIVAGSV